MEENKAKDGDFFEGGVISPEEDSVFIYPKQTEDLTPEFLSKKKGKTAPLTEIENKVRTEEEKKRRVSEILEL